jgi:ribonucleoside-diphosphate reductase alpha chain
MIPHTGQRLLSDLVAHSKYAQYLPNEERRESRVETIERNYAMHLRKFPHMKDELDYAYGLIKDQYFVPSMRSLQFGGAAIEKTNEKVFNCSFLNITEPKCFSEIMFLLLCGTGVGYSVKWRHVGNLPTVTRPTTTVDHIVGDSIEGWADAVDALISAYLLGRALPNFIYDQVRGKGSRLSTGVIAPGPDKLRISLDKVKELLESAVGNKLKPIDAHDIACTLADAVLSGGIRRSAMICLFDWDDLDMLTCKDKDKMDEFPHRTLSNNSAHILKNTPDTKKQYDFIVDYTKRSLRNGSGDPGILFTNDLDTGTNPCSEVALRENFCNLCDINGKQILDQATFDNVSRYASLVGTLQASYTDFKYLRPIWRQRTEEEALIGVGITSVVEGRVLDLDMRQAALTTVEANRQYANMIGINPAWRTTVIKPSGTSTLYLGNMGSGCHDIPISPDTSHYIRRMRVAKTEPIYFYLKTVMPDLIEDCYYNPDVTAVISIPMMVDKSVPVHTANTPIDFLERVKYLNENWVQPGYTQGVNQNNVSATCNVSNSDHDEVFNWLWDNRDSYMGMSVLPKWETGGDTNYPQMPIEQCTEEVFNAHSKHLVNFNAEGVYEPQDMTKLVENLACVGGACDVVEL